MSDLSASASLYAHVALVRHRILLQHAANRAVIGVVAVLMLLVGFGLLNAALFLYLRPALGDIAALLVAALIHLAIGSLAMALTWKEYTPPELEALANAEASALKRYVLMPAVPLIASRPSKIKLPAWAPISPLAWPRFLACRRYWRAPQNLRHQRNNAIPVFKHCSGGFAQRFRFSKRQSLGAPTPEATLTPSSS